MWTRANLKAKAKVAFKRNYWKCVIVALLLGTVLGSAGSVGSSIGSSASQTTNTIISDDVYDEEFQLDEFYEDDTIPFVAAILSTVTLFVVIVVILAALAISVFVLGPLEVGCRNFFKLNANEVAELNKITLPFKKNNYWKMVGTIFFKNLYIVLWSLLLVIPGIIKSLEYRMIPYILSDCPDMPRKEAFRISKEMMKGHKMDSFLLDLSFIGWSLLSIITCNIAGVFYVQPYIAATDAELFIAIREEYFQKQRG